QGASATGLLLGFEDGRRDACLRTAWDPAAARRGCVARPRGLRLSLPPSAPPPPRLRPDAARRRLPDRRPLARDRDRTRGERATRAPAGAGPAGARPAREPAPLDGNRPRLRRPRLRDRRPAPPAGA